MMFLISNKPYSIFLLKEKLFLGRGNFYLSFELYVRRWDGGDVGVEADCLTRSLLVECPP